MSASPSARWRAALALAALVLAARPALAIDELVSTRGVGAAEALRAQGSGATALFLNPAGIASIRQYAMEGNYQYRPEDSTHMAAGSIVDSVTAEVAVGAYVHYLTGSAELDGESADRSGIEGGLGLAYPFSRNFLLGVKGKYLNADRAALPGADAVDINDFSFDAGAILRFGGLSLGVTGNSLNAELPEWRKQLGLGAGYTFGETLLLEFDALLDFDKNEALGRADEVAPRYSGCLELFLAEAYALRGGAIHDRADDATWATFGAGIFNPGSGLEVGFRQQVQGGDETLLSVGLKLFVQ